MGFNNGGEDAGAAKLELPPGQVVRGISGRGMQDERTVVKRGEHGLHAGEVSSSCRDDQRRVQQLAMKFLRLEKVVCAFSAPIGDGGEILEFFLVWEVYLPRV